MRGSECRIDETNQTEGYYRFDATGAVIKNAQGQPIVFARGVTKWYVYDGLGSVVGEVDPSGNLTSSPKYDVYGLVRQNPGTASSAMGFVGGLGHLSEANTGLIYMRARYYDPSLGRFASEDPGKNGLNWFIYCDDSPVNKVDFTGKMAFLAAVGVVLLAMLASAVLAGVGAAIFNAVYQFVATGHVDWGQVEDTGLQGAAFGAVAGLILGICTVLGAGAILLAGAGAIASVALGAAFLYALAITILVGAVAGAVMGGDSPFAPPPQ